MKKMYFLISYFVLFLILPAHAILSPEPDQLGLYFDTEADWVCVDGIAPYTIVPMYLIYTHPTPDTISGISVGLHVEGNVLLLTLDLPGDPIFPPEPFRWQASWPEPEPTSEAMVIVSFSLLYLSTTNEPVSFYMGSFDEPQGGSPEIIMPDGTFVPTEMIFPNGEWTAGWNSGCDIIPISTERQSFSAVKSMYR